MCLKGLILGFFFNLFRRRGYWLHLGLFVHKVYLLVDFVILSVCVCHLQVTILTDLHETSPDGGVCHKEEVHCFWGQKINIGQRSTTNVGCLKCLIFIPLIWNFKSIYISRHWIQPDNYFWEQLWRKGKNRPKVNNYGGISKILNFQPIDLIFEEDLHISSLNSTTNYIWGQHWPKGQHRPKVNY